MAEERRSGGRINLLAKMGRRNYVPFKIIILIKEWMVILRPLVGCE